MLTVSGPQSLPSGLVARVERALAQRKENSPRKKNGWMSMKVWGLCHESPPGLVLGGIPRGGLQEVMFGRVGEQGCG